MNWTAKWITGSASIDADSKVAPYLFKKEISTDKPVKKAVVFATALGAYNIYIDGVKISDRFLAPGYTEYFDRVQFQEYDVTALIKGGKQLVTAELADGWYTGRLGLVIKENNWGKKRALMAELHITYEDGSEDVIITDATWMVTTDGPRRNASIFDGEVYDATMESMALQSYAPAVIYTGKLPETIVPDCGAPLTLHEKVRPVRIFKAEDGDTMVDFGRNMAGIVEIGPFEGKKGQKIFIKHGEVVQNGVLYTENLRTAKQRIDYTAKDGVQTYRPEFTTMGFQYLSISGYDVTEDNIAAYEIYSDMEEIGFFECSDERINQFTRNVKTSTKANFVDIPTDCPQRDERCGWTGDIAVFAPTAAFQFDIRRFMNKWLGDLALVQRDMKTGVVPWVVPSNGFTKHRLKNLKNTWAVMYNLVDAIWGDSATLVPWAVYQAYGDKNVLEKQYDSMKKWVDFETRRASSGKDKLIYTDIWQLGDWLAPGENIKQWTEKAKWTSTAYFANSADIMAQSAEILGRTDDAAKYKKLGEDIRAAYRKKFVDADGHITGATQSVWVTALMYKMLTPDQEQIAINDLVDDIRKHDNHLATGFAGTDKLLFALSDFGRADVAWDVMMQETFPSWIYPVLCGGTSTWERWDSLTPEGVVNEVDDGPKGMCSFNHYAYGAAANWLFTRAAGLQMTKPGYEEFKIAPMPGGGLTWAKASRKTEYGTIESRWDILEDGSVKLAFTVPEGTKATVVALDDTETVYEAGSYEVTI